MFVANSEIADVAIKSPQLIYVFAKRPGTTTLYAVGANDEILASISLNVTHNLSRLDRAIADLMPGRNIAATSIEGAIVLTGMVSSPGEAEDARRLAARFIGATEEVINRLQINQPNQVNVRVRIAEVNKSVLRNLGINWDVAIQQGGFAFGMATAFPVMVGSTLLGSTGSPGTAPTVSTGPLDLTATMDLLAQEGLVSLLAEPNSDCRLGPDGDVPGGRRVSDPGLAGQQHDHHRVPAVRCEPGVHADDPERQSHQHARAPRGQLYLHLESGHHRGFRRAVAGRASGGDDR